MHPNLGNSWLSQKVWGGHGYDSKPPSPNPPAFVPHSTVMKMTREGYGLET